MLRALLIVTSVIAAGSVHAGESSCVGLADLQKQLQANVSSSPLSWAGCGSLTNVFKRLLAGKRTGGRRLEGEKPFDMAEAQANVQAALRDPDVVRKLELMRTAVQDENLRLAYEAAIFDGEGFYAARDLRIQQLSERSK
jgi:hypothetical protein